MRRDALGSTGKRTKFALVITTVTTNLEFIVMYIAHNAITIAHAVALPFCGSPQSHRLVGTGVVGNPVRANFRHTLTPSWSWCVSLL